MSLIDEFWELSEEDLDMLCILVYMKEKNQFDEQMEQMYFKLKESRRKSVRIGAFGSFVFCLSWTIIFLFAPDNLTESLSITEPAWLFASFVTLIFIVWFFYWISLDCSYNGYSREELWSAKEFFRLRKIIPKLTVREYYERRKAKMMDKYIQKNQKEFDDIRQVAEDLDLI